MNQQWYSWRRDFVALLLVLLAGGVFVDFLEAQSNKPKATSRKVREAQMEINRLDLIFISKSRTQKYFENYMEGVCKDLENPGSIMGFTFGKSMNRFGVMQVKMYAAYYLEDYELASETARELLELAEGIEEHKIRELVEVEQAIAKQVLGLDEDKQKEFSRALAWFKTYSSKWSSFDEKQRWATVERVTEALQDAREGLVRSVGEENWFTADATEFLFMLRSQYDESYDPDPAILDKVVEHRLRYPMVNRGNTQVLQTQQLNAMTLQQRGEIEKAVPKLAEIVQGARKGQPYLYQLSATSAWASALMSIDQVHYARAAMVEIVGRMPPDFLKKNPDMLTLLKFLELHVGLSSLHSHCGDEKAARESVETCMSYLQKLKDDFPHTNSQRMMLQHTLREKMRLIEVMSQIGDTENAEKLLAATSEQVLQSYGSDSSNHALILIGRAEIFTELERYQSAIQEYQKAIDVLKNVKLDKDTIALRIAFAHRGIAYAKSMLEDYEGAQLEFTKAEQLLASLSEKFQVSSVSTSAWNSIDSAENLRILDRHPEAFERVQKVLARSREILSQAFLFKNFQEAKYELLLFKEALDYLLVTAEMSDPKVRQQALAYSIDVKSQLFESLRQREKLMRVVDESDNWKLRREFMFARSQFAARLFEKLATDDFNDLDLVVGAEVQVKELLQTLPLYLPEAKVDELRPSDVIAELGKSMPEDVVFVEVLRNQRMFNADKDYVSRYQAFVFFKQEGELQVRFVEMGDAESIDRDIKTWIEIFKLQASGEADRGIKRTKNGKNSAAKVGERLLNNVWKKLEPEFGGRTKVAFVGDGETRRLPWGTIPNGKAVTLPDGSEVTGRVIDEYEVFTLPSTTEFIRSQSLQRASTGEVAFVADVDYGPVVKRDKLKQPLATNFQEWSHLPNTKSEGEAFSGCLSDIAKVVEFSGQEATEEQFLRQLGELDVVHIATHGFSFIESEGAEQKEGAKSVELKDMMQGNPWALCGLAFANANVPNEDAELADGLLFGNEIVGCNLENLKLVVLSACSTGTGIVFEDMNVHGVQQAFLFAGAQSTVGSYWPVADDKTAEFMKLFYEGLSQNLTVSEALRNAQLSFRQKGEPMGSWGAWMVSGDWQVRIGK